MMNGLTKHEKLGVGCIALVVVDVVLSFVAALLYLIHVVTR